MLNSSKYLKYSQDGSGRDTYIYNDNGGFERPKKDIVPIKDPGNFVKYPPIKNNIANFMNRPKKYMHNGSGRDSYIYSDDGGFCPGYMKTNFLKILRQSSFLGSSPQRKTRHYSNKKEMLATIVMKRSQDKISRKLAMPSQRSTDNPQKYGNPNYEFRQTTKWLQTLGHRQHQKLGQSKVRNRSTKYLYS